MLAWHGASGDLEQKALQAGARPEAEWLQINAVFGGQEQEATRGSWHRY